MGIRFLNLACGDFYLKDADWVNLDWYPHSKYVRKANLLNKLEFEDNTFEVIYSSHFLEHIQLENLNLVLSECFRVLKPNGILRIVVPDLENIVREYIKNLDNGEMEKAEFNTIELLDQCVRVRSGGQLASYRAKPELSQGLRDYISERTGYVYKSSLDQPHNISRKSLLKIKQVSKYRIQWLYCRALTSLMPKWFIQNHVNFINTGELHRWVFDEHSLTKNLSAIGFKRMLRVESNFSQIQNFPFVPLDLDDNQRSRKGTESIYMEATK